jgi:5-methylcytosine-specific restriction protein A
MRASSEKRPVARKSAPPVFIARGKKGLARGGKGDEEVWNLFSTRETEFGAAAEAIRAAIATGARGPDEFAGIVDAPEGRLLTRIHISRERNRSLVEKKKNQALRTYGHLACEGCHFDYLKVYGERGKGFMEAHHLKPLHTLLPGTMTRLEDLALLCANCHRMVHAQNPWLDLAALRMILRVTNP